MKTKDHIENLLDHALEMTFPASDPFTVYIAELEVVAEDEVPEADTINLVPTRNVT